jgi:hypothetical protein
MNKCLAESSNLIFIVMTTSYNLIVTSCHDFKESLILVKTFVHHHDRHHQLLLLIDNNIYMNIT